MENPFSVLQIEPSLDLKDLDQYYLSLQSKVHPDLYHNLLEKEAAEKLCAKINQAYLSLKDPYSLGKSLLLALNLSTDYKVDDDFLLDVLEGNVCAKKLWDDFYQAWKIKNYTHLAEFFVKWSFASKRNQINVKQ